MIKILIVHNYKNKSAASYKETLCKKYDFLTMKNTIDNSKLYSIAVVKLGNKIPKRKFDKIYFDSDTITTKDILPFIQKNPNAYIIWVSLSNKKARLSTITVAPVKKLRKKPVKKKS
jgi:hypothetical protein